MIKSNKKRITLVLTAIVVGVLISMFVRASTGPGKLGVTDGRLAPCLKPNNCVSSDSTDDRNWIEPLSAGISAEETWEALAEIIAATPRTRIITATDDYLHAEVRMPLIPYVDDLEVHLRHGDEQIAVRSVARAGSWDFGVNRRRVESIRQKLERLPSVTK